MLLLTMISALSSRSILLAVLGVSVVCALLYGGLVMHQRSTDDALLATHLEQEFVESFLQTDRKEAFIAFLKKHGKMVPSIIPDGVLFEAAVIQQSATGSLQVIGAVHQAQNERRTMITIEPLTIERTIHHPLSEERWYRALQQRDEKHFLFTAMKSQEKGEKEAMNKVRSLGAHGRVMVGENNRKGIIIFTGSALPETEETLTILQNHDVLLRIHSTAALLSRWTSIMTDNAPMLGRGIEAIVAKQKTRIDLGAQINELLSNLPYAYSIGKNDAGDIITVLSTTLNPATIHNVLIPVLSQQQSYGSVQETVLPNKEIFREVLPSKREQPPQESDGWSIYQQESWLIGIRGTSVVIGNNMAIFKAGNLREDTRTEIASFQGTPEAFFQIMEKTLPFLAREERNIWQSEGRREENQRIHLSLSSSASDTWMEWEVL